MKCPSCTDALLVMTERQSVEVDYCPMCRGVWLDRGELDKLIERAATASSAMANPRARRDFEDSDHSGARNRPAAQRKSWLNDIFD